ncbi:DUF1345 domain-containing protein [Sediminicoccus sp. KRV36]|uniref:DUF1345 domain-containing protein n=1 Tax=Sediminicoccus sp. KRV36 TaxID=3133721 RepID=UPI00200F4BB3|nr:DUF1345 domain-containing protein [Sediminicoccus rosea]UPY37574.1 DUF1345 domain-containing protein [Sediminicoccus rosea]
MRLPGILRHGFTLQGLGTGSATFLLLWALGLSLETAGMLGWSAHILIYAGLVLHRLGDAPAEAMRGRAREMTGGRAVLTGLSVLAAGASLLFLVLRWDGQAGAIAILAIILSWFYVHLLFAQEYAHEYWMQERGLVFPGGDGTPEFAEFLYFAFTIGMTFQVSDVTTDSPGMRRLVLLHGLVAFAFNAVILAAAVNIVAGAAG